MSFKRGGRGGRGVGGGGYQSAPYDYSGYGGQSAPSLFNSGGMGGMSNYDHISYDTSSKDPVLMRARVFAGNVNTFVAGRDELIELFSSYGTVLGMTVFKGYAFVQFANEEEADYAVQCTNGMVWNNQQLDVKLAITGMKQNPAARKQPQAAYGVQGVTAAKRPYPMFGGLEASQPKKPKGGAVVQNAANQKAAIDDSTTNGDLHESAFADTMICGNCRSVFTDFVQFRDHRRAACAIPSVKQENEPESMQCFTCEETCTSSWSLVQHLVSRHGLVLYK